MWNSIETKRSKEKRRQEKKAKKEKIWNKHYATGKKFYAIPRRPEDSENLEKQLRIAGLQFCLKYVIPPEVLAKYTEMIVLTKETVAPTTDEKYEYSDCYPVINNYGDRVLLRRPYMPIMDLIKEE